MTQTTVLPLGTYPTGQRLIGPVSVPDGISSVAFAIQRDTPTDTTIWSDPGTVISLSWDVSLDGGNTWSNLGGFSANGGQVNGKNGQPLAFSTGQIQFPSATGRQVRINASITGSAVKTSVQMTVS